MTTVTEYPLHIVPLDDEGEVYASQGHHCPGLFLQTAREEYESGVDDPLHSYKMADVKHRHAVWTEEGDDLFLMLVDEPKEGSVPTTIVGWC